MMSVFCGEALEGLEGGREELGEEPDFVPTNRGKTRL
jgi:hypothetical protein